MSLCLSVHLLAYLTNHMSKLHKVFTVRVTYGHGLVLLWQGDEIQGEGQFWGFSSPLTMQYTAWHLGPIQKQLNWSTCCLAWWVGLARRTVCYVGVTIPKGEWAILQENMSDKPNTANNIDFGYEGPISLKFTYLPWSGTEFNFLLWKDIIWTNYFKITRILK